MHGKFRCVKRTVADAFLPVKYYCNKFLSFFYYVPELISVADYEYFGGKYYSYADETNQVDFGVDVYDKDRYAYVLAIHSF